MAPFVKSRHTSSYLAVILSAAIASLPIKVHAEDGDAQLKIYQHEFDKAVIEFHAEHFNEAYDHFIQAGDAIATSNKKFAAFAHLMAMDVVRSNISLNRETSSELRAAVEYIDMSILPTISAVESPDLWSRAKFYRGLFRSEIAIKDQKKASKIDMASFAIELKSALADYNDAIQHADKVKHSDIWCRIAFQIVGIETLLGKQEKNTKMLLHARSLANDAISALRGIDRDHLTSDLEKKMREIDSTVSMLKGQ